MITIPFGSLGVDPCGELKALADQDRSLVIDCINVPRLPVSLLAAIAQVQASGAVIALDHLSLASRQALQMISHDYLPDDASGPLSVIFKSEPPYEVAIDGHGLLVTALPGMAQHPQLANETATAWIGGLVCESFTIDLAAIEHVNSILVAWLLRAAQLTVTVRPTVINVKPVSIAQLARLRLDHLIEIQVPE